MLAALRPTNYRFIEASARGYAPAKTKDVQLVAGQRVTGIDLVMAPGGAEITGIVLDASGGPIAGAQVTAGTFEGEACARGESAADGTFALWGGPGIGNVIATADGYARGETNIFAPDPAVEVVLTPASSVAGTIVDAKTGAPVAGARVLVGDDRTVTDDSGAFLVEGLEPGQFTVTATSDHGHGTSDRPISVGLARDVTGVVVKLQPAVHVDGRIVVERTRAPCPQPYALLRRDTYLSEGTPESDGHVRINGVRPGTYTVELDCPGHYVTRLPSPVTVGEADIDGLVWEVAPGARLAGTLRTHQGEPVFGATVFASLHGDPSRSSGARTTFDGTFEILGLKPGTYAVGAQLLDQDVAAVVQHVVVDTARDVDLVLEETGSLQVSVVDPTDKPVAGVEVHANLPDRFMFAIGDDERTRADGLRTFPLLRPGEYEVIATAPGAGPVALRDPGAKGGAPPLRVVVRAGQQTKAKLRIEPVTLGAITGSVRDDRGTLVTDAFVSVTIGMWTRRVLTRGDGTFKLTKLFPGTYRVSAGRFAESATTVSAATGDHVTIVLPPS